MVSFIFVRDPGSFNTIDYVSFSTTSCFKNFLLVGVAIDTFRDGRKNWAPVFLDTLIPDRYFVIPECFISTHKNRNVENFRNILIAGIERYLDIGSYDPAHCIEFREFILRVVDEVTKKV